jgi:hypothetical protein
VKIGWLTTGPHPYFEDFRLRLKDLGCSPSFLIRADDVIQ